MKQGDSYNNGSEGCLRDSLRVCAAGAKNFGYATNAAFLRLFVSLVSQPFGTGGDTLKG